jgi:hypothetical protein
MVFDSQEVYSIMGLPDELTALLREGSRAVQHDPYHDLPPGSRWGIQELMVQGAIDQGREERAGFKAWLSAEIMAVEHVLPLWEQEFPNEETPRRLLAEAGHFLRDSLDLKTAGILAFSFPEDTGSRRPVEYVLGGALRALEFAVRAGSSQASLNSLRRNKSLTNRQLEFPHDWDAALCASVAYADDASLCAVHGRGRRRQFWEWWLTEVVPKAFETFIADPD